MQGWSESVHFYILEGGLCRARFISLPFHPWVSDVDYPGFEFVYIHCCEQGSQFRTITNRMQTVQILTRLEPFNRIYTVCAGIRAEEMLTLPSQQTDRDTFVNGADPDETARNEPSHQDLHCLQLCYWFLTEIPFRNNECVQIKIWKSPFQKFRREKVKLSVIGINVYRETTNKPFASFSREIYISYHQETSENTNQAVYLAWVWPWSSKRSDIVYRWLENALMKLDGCTGHSRFPPLHDCFIFISHYWMQTLQMMAM